MKDIVCQFTGQHLVPCSPEDAEQLSAEYKRNQLVRCKTTRVSKVMEPSVVQLNLLMACFGLVVENSRCPSTSTKERAKLACKVDIDYLDYSMMIVKPDGRVIVPPKSFSFQDLQDMNRLNVIQRAFDWCADQIGVTVEKLIEEAQAKMQRRGPERVAA